MKSPHTGFTTIVDNYSEWEVKLTFAPQSRTGARAFLAWFDRLQGSVGTFTYQPHGYGKAVTGKTLFSTGYAYATSIVATGWTASAATGLDEGDLFTLAGKLYRITTVPANADGSGKATISFEPGLPADVAAATSINFATPTVTLRVVQGDEADGGGVSIDSDFLYLDGITARSVQ